MVISAAQDSGGGERRQGYAGRKRTALKTELLSRGLATTGTTGTRIMHVYRDFIQFHALYGVYRVI